MQTGARGKNAMARMPKIRQQMLLCEYLYEYIYPMGARRNPTAKGVSRTNGRETAREEASNLCNVTADIPEGSTFMPPPDGHYHGML